ncbi:MAG: molybdopterin-dependent oxidoreductase [Bacteroidales bacterium]|nr:molybdopterin-dependent oxidoreductase [Bacteroidales bacterium]
MNQRITTPYIKKNGQLEEVSFEEAFQYVGQKLQNPESNSTLVMSSGSYSNETLYLLQRLARTALNTNALDSFDYYRRGTDFFADKNDILPFAEMFSSDKFYCVLPDVETCHGASLQTPETLKAVFEVLKHCPDTPRYWFNKPDTLNVTDYYAFFRSVNFYLIQHHLEKGIYVDVLGKNYGAYKQSLMADDYEELLHKNNLKDADIQLFVEDLITIQAPAFIVWEQWLTEPAYHELENMCMLLDVQSKPASGFLTIKSELNSQGLFDMGMFPHIAPGGHKMTAQRQEKMVSLWQTNVCTESVDVAATIDGSGFRNVLIWNALNANVSQDIVNQIDNSDFAMLQTAYLPENANMYDVILPANLPEEISGTYTDTAKVPHNFITEADHILEYNNLQQIVKIAELLGHPFPSNKDDIFLEYISFMEAGCHSSERHFFK